MTNEMQISHLDGTNGVTNKIKQAMYDAAKQFVYIGFLLWEVQQYGYYEEKGYKSVYDYAAQELGFKTTTTKNMMAINYAFGCRNERESGGIANSRTMSLQPAYEKFNYSQLTEMLSMSEKQRAQVTPDMTIKKIREIKKQDKEIDFKTLDEIIKKNQTSDQEPEFPLEPEYGTTPIEVYTESQTSDRRYEYTITMDRADWEVIIEQLDDNIKYNYGDPEDIDNMTRIRDEIIGIIKYQEGN